MTIELETSVTAAQVRTAILVLETGGVDITGNVSQAMLKRLRNAADALEANVPQPTGLPHPLDIASEYLTDRGACPECSHPVHTTNGPVRGWVHTETGEYRCPDGSGWAGPAVTYDQLAAKRATPTGARTRRRSTTKIEQARQEGRTELHNEMDEAISAAMEQIGDDATADELREALASAWNSVAP